MELFIHRSQRPTHNLTNSQFKPHYPQSKHSHPTTIQPKSTTHLPDITIPANLIWQTLKALNLNHLPILITFKNKYKIHTTKPFKTLTNYRKANWLQYTKDIEHTLKTPPFRKSPTQLTTSLQTLYSHQTTIIFPKEQ